MCKIGLVLSGGMAKGAYQLGALKAISEYFKPEDIEYISASSIGTLNAYAFSAGKLEMAEKMWRGLCLGDSKLFITTICKSAFLQNSIEELTTPEDKIAQYFYTTLYNVKGNSLAYFNLSEADPNKWEKYLKASVTMPFYATPICIDETYFCDGAMVDNIPVFPIKKHEVDYLFCIHFDECNYMFENKDVNSKIIKLIFSDKSIIRNSIFFDRRKIEYMIDTGYSQTKKNLEVIFAKGTDDVEYIYKNIDVHNRLSSNVKLRVSGDMIVSNCNKIAKKIIRNKIIT